MPRILHVHASPRPESFSLRLAKAFLNAYVQKHPNFGFETLDLFDADLPPFDAAAAAAKYGLIYGLQPLDTNAEVWHRVTQLIEQFKSADMHVISSPMWNFGIPYRLKQYFDILVQPGITFAHSPAAGSYRGLVTGRPMVLLLARGGSYPSGTIDAQFDLQTPYLELILKFIGVTEFHTVVVEETLAGPDTAEKAAQEAIRKAIELAQQM